jgi:hypothetical protein
VRATAWWCRKVAICAHGDGDGTGQRPNRAQGEGRQRRRDGDAQAWATATALRFCAVLCSVNWPPSSLDREWGRRGGGACNLYPGTFSLGWYNQPRLKTL